MTKKVKLNTQPLTGDQCKALRKAIQLNQKDFWDQVCVTQSGGSRYESGRELPEPVEVLVRRVWLNQSVAEAVAVVNARRGVVASYVSDEPTPAANTARDKIRKALGIKS